MTVFATENCGRTAPRNRHQIRVSAVLPVYNESAILRQLTLQLIDVLEPQSRAFEIVYVNDGSTDTTRNILDELSSVDSRIVVIHLARNFGHQAAVHAGLEHALGDAVLVMDSDLQDDPCAIRQFLSRWEDGFDVVYAQRTNRKESLPKRMLFYSFYRILNSVASTAMPEDAGNFGLIDRRVVTALLSLPERDRYFPGLRSWAGFRQTGVPVERGARHDSHPRVSMRGLFRLAKTAVFSFSAFPLTFFYIIAAMSAAVCSGAIGFVLFHKMFTGLAVPGWASTIITASFFGSLNALGISILGEYVIRIYDQVRSRPVYLAESTRNVGCSARELPATRAESFPVAHYSVRSDSSGPQEPNPMAHSSEDAVTSLLESIQRDFRQVAVPRTSRGDEIAASGDSPESRNRTGSMHCFPFDGEDSQSPSQYR